eukprot:PhM_4_TR144/c0_g2_i1/m.10774/K03679/RRP4, EXOSC2; exosome complex component RRP4
MIVITGETVGNTAETLKGYNTYGVEDSHKIATAVCGYVDSVERVVSVRTPSKRYLGESGDVVVGRVKEVSGTRWKVDVGSHQDAIMLLSNVTEPGGVLRRRGREDEIQMRSIFAEGDVVACEVQRVMHDGTVSLHTRSPEKYGKLGEGVMVLVRPQLVPKTRKHFYVLEAVPSVRLIVGVNGFIWVHGRNADSLEGRCDLARTRNAVELLDRSLKEIHVEFVEHVIAKSIELQLTPWQMLLPQNAAPLLVFKRGRGSV